MKCALNPCSYLKYLNWWIYLKWIHRRNSVNSAKFFQRARVQKQRCGKKRSSFAGKRPEVTLQPDNCTRENLIPRTNVVCLYPHTNTQIHKKKRWYSLVTNLSRPTQKESINTLRLTSEMKSVVLWECVALMLGVIFAIWSLNASPHSISASSKLCSIFWEALTLKINHGTQ